MSTFRDRHRSIDRWQQRQPLLGFPYAVVQKYVDDQGGYLVAAITYYGFFAVFPLLLVLTTVLGFVLHGHTHLERSIVNSALGQFPVVGPDLVQRSLHGSALILGIGIVAALWASMNVFLALQHAMNQLWGVPYTRRPNAVHARLRALLLLLVLGAGLIVSTVLGSVATVGAGFALGWNGLAIVLATLLNVGIFWFGFRVSTAREVEWRQLRGGAIAAGVLYQALQLLGGYYVGHTLRHAGNVYGTFGLVIGLLSWIFLAAQITVLAAEANVVATKRLWPRSFSVGIEESTTPADERALTQRGKVEERRHDETVSVTFEDSAHP